MCVPKNTFHYTHIEESNLKVNIGEQFLSSTINRYRLWMRGSSRLPESDHRFHVESFPHYFLQNLAPQSIAIRLATSESLGM